jgi:hypothetical protein
MIIRKSAAGPDLEPIQSSSDYQHYLCSYAAQILLPLRACLPLSFIPSKILWASEFLSNGTVGSTGKASGFYSGGAR